MLSIEEHIDLVEENLETLIAHLHRRALIHDASKLKSPEIELFLEYIPKLANTTYGSEEYFEYLKLLKPALDHHYANNSHHPEYYIDGIRDMDLVDICEMLCDWCAAVKNHKDGDIFRSIEFNQQRFGYSNDIKQIFINTVQRILK